MHVLQVNKFFYEKGGTERYFFSLSRSLERRGHAVSHFSMSHPDNLESPFSEYFVSQKDYAVRDAQPYDAAAGVSFIRSREAARNIGRLIEAETPDIAHLHNIYHQITPSIIPVLKRAGVPVVMTLHDYKLICPNYSLFDGKAYCYRCKGDRFLNAVAARCNNGSVARSALLSVEAYWQKWTGVYDDVGLFFAPSRFMRDTFVEAGYAAGRVVYVPPYVPADTAAPARAGGDTAIDELPEKYVVYFGRLSAEKGLPTLLDAVFRLRDIPLVVCGDGPLRESLEQRVASSGVRNVEFAGHLGKPELDLVVRRATAAVLPTESPENAPYTVLEAMEHGVPIVVSDMGGLPELAELCDGIVFPAGDACALAKAIKEVWSDGSRAAGMGHKGRTAVAEKLTERRHMDSIEELYKRAIESTNRGTG
jgi:glycosyltransferase involved in cell wall biosynthesis